LNRCLKQIYGGIVTENPTFVLMLGMCPTLAVTTEARNGLGMGISTAAVLILSNMLVSMLRNIIPGNVRIPAYIVIVATLVTVAGFIMQAYFKHIYDALGVYVPLIVVNCIILGRAEGFASKHDVVLSVCDGLGMGTGFTLGLTVIGAVREFLGKGTLFDYDINNNILGGSFTPVSIMVLAPGAFFVLAFICAVRNSMIRSDRKNVKSCQSDVAGNTDEKCMGNCMVCPGNCRESNR